MTFLGKAVKSEAARYTRSPSVGISGPGSTIDLTSAAKPETQALMALNVELSRTWVPTGAIANGKGVAGVNFSLPTINTFCDTCAKSPPFNPVPESSVYGYDQNDQFFWLSYQCQQCKGRPVRFMVRRDKIKFQLTGRDPIEALPTPNDLPKAVSRYYGESQIAHNAGQTLAGLFLLRVFVEQYWRQMPTVQEVLKADPRATGDKLGETYQATLPDDFKSRFPSLKDIYSQLSAAMHAADRNAPLFEECSADVVKHFQARKLFEL